MSNVQGRRLRGPTAQDEKDAEALRRNPKPPAVRLKEQLEAIHRKWERLLGPNFGASADEEYKGGGDPRVE